MKRLWTIALLTAALLTGCGTQEVSDPPGETPEDPLTEADVLNCYAKSEAKRS